MIEQERDSNLTPLWLEAAGLVGASLYVAVLLASAFFFPWASFYLALVLPIGIVGLILYTAASVAIEQRGVFRRTATFFKVLGFIALVIAAYVFSSNRWN